jgi:sigma-B regulation protein RsbU (phosphoserine phosphatase)
VTVSLERAADLFRQALLEDDPALLYDQAPCGYLSTTPDGHIVKVNATFCTWLGAEPADLLGRRFVDLLTHGGQIYHETHYAPMLQMQGFVREIAVDVVRSDGSRLPVLLNASLLRAEDGSPQVVRVAVFDATERRAYERELVRARDAALDAESRARALTRTLQNSFIPPLDPVVPGLDVATAYRPAGDGTEVGGDFFDVFPAGPRDWAIALGDVSGKGVEAAVLTSVARTTVRALTVLGHDLPEVLQGLNEVMRQNESDKFCTLVLARLRREGALWRTTLAVGGHPPPLLVRPGSEPVLVDAGGPLIGLLPEVGFVEKDLSLTAADTLILYTDGVTEARGEGGYFGEERFLGWARQQTDGDPSALVESLLAEVLDYQGGRARDDIAILAFRPA